MRANVLLLVAAMIWGSAFVAQRVGADAMAPASFTGVRHVLGFLVLLPVVTFFDAASRRDKQERRARWRAALVPGALIGTALTGGSLLQQAGLAFTTAGNAGFITGLYMVFIPVTAFVVFRQTTSWTAWLGVGLALVGLFLLSVGDTFHVNVGDLLVLGCAVFWTAHILAIERFGHVDPLRLCVVQFGTCALVCSIVALGSEPRPFAGLADAVVPLLYAGVLSSGVAFTLQVIAQRDAKASHAAMIMALEAVFAAVGGAWWLSERMSARGLVGAALMLAAVLVAQLGAVAEVRAGPEPRPLPHVPEP